MAISSSQMNNTCVRTADTTISNRILLLLLKIHVYFFFYFSVNPIIDILIMMCLNFIRGMCQTDFFFGIFAFHFLTSV